MTSLTKRTIREDISLRSPSSSLWEFEKIKPEIRQIYGHFLPPSHRKFVRGLVAKDFNFPPAYHNVPDSHGLNEQYKDGERITADTIISINNALKIRAEREGAIVYTPYFNGFYMNQSAYQILKRCEHGTPVKNIMSTLELDPKSVLEFLARALTLGIINVHTS